VEEVERETERERERKGGKNWEEASFLAVYEPKFLLLQAIKSIPIYRSWKRVILSSLRKTFDP
jgi:hypothetical protein